MGLGLYFTTIRMYDPVANRPHHFYAIHKWAVHALSIIINKIKACWQFFYGPDTIKRKLQHMTFENIRRLGDGRLSVIGSISVSNLEANAKILELFNACFVIDQTAQNNFKISKADRETLKSFLAALSLEQVCWLLKQDNLKAKKQQVQFLRENVEMRRNGAVDKLMEMLTFAQRVRLYVSVVDAHENSWPYWRDQIEKTIQYLNERENGVIQSEEKVSAETVQTFLKRVVKPLHCSKRLKELPDSIKKKVESLKPKAVQPKPNKQLQELEKLCVAVRKIDDNQLKSFLEPLSLDNLRLLFQNEHLTAKRLAILLCVIQSRSSKAVHEFVVGLTFGERVKLFLNVIEEGEKGGLCYWEKHIKNAIHGLDILEKGLVESGEKIGGEDLQQFVARVVKPLNCTIIALNLLPQSMQKKVMCLIKAEEILPKPRSVFDEEPSQLRLFNLGCMVREEREKFLQGLSNYDLTNYATATKESWEYLRTNEQEKDMPPAVEASLHILLTVQNRIIGKKINKPSLDRLKAVFSDYVVKKLSEDNPIAAEIVKVIKFIMETESTSAPVEKKAA